MPEERGSIYKSTANEIGEALKAKLGGEGFAPKDWSESLNLLGIASEDTEAAINSLKESEGSGERGSILLSTANAIGTMLNKKYNSQRGFSPAEWASATRKMKALETDTKSGGIVNLKGAKEVPLTSLVGTINPTLEGTDTLTATRLGKNLWEFGDKTVDTVAYIILYFTKPLPAGTYTISCSLISTTTTCSFRFRKEDGSYLEQTTFQANVGRVSKTLTISEPAYRVYIYSSTQGGGEVTTWKDVQIEIGSEATAYTPYVAPTTYTANLGRTIYGGSGDIVKGEGVESYRNTSLADENYYYSSSLQRFDCTLDGVISSGYNDDFTPPQDYTIDHSLINDATNAPDHSMCIYGGKLYIKNLSCSSVSELVIDMSGKYLTYSLATSEDFTFDPIPINTSGDTENFYTSHGDTAITYYEPPTAYTRGSASGMIASIPEANTEFPFTKLKSTIAPSVDGKDTVEVYNYGKNLFNKEEPNVVNGYINTTGTKFTSGDNWRTLFLPVVSGATYTVSRTPGHSFRVATSQVPPTNNALYISTIANHTGTSITVTIDSNAKYLWVFFWASSNDPDITPEEIIPTIQIEAGSEATTFEEYKQPTTYTAELGETVHGGSVDFASGEVISGFGSVDLGSLTWIYDSANTRFYTASLSSVIEKGSSGWKTELLTDIYTTASGTENDKTISEYASTGYVYIKDTDYTDANAFKAHVTGHNLSYPLATPSELSIESQEIYPREGVNNIWNDANGITEVEYFGD